MSDRLFLDTNVLLDHLLDRESFADDATELWSMAERRDIVGCIAAISFNFVYYIVRHEANERKARTAIKGMRDVFEIVEVDAQVINQALDADFTAFEEPSNMRAPCEPARLTSLRVICQASAVRKSPYLPPKLIWPRSQRTDCAIRWTHLPLPSSL